MITLGKNGNLAARRRAAAYLRDERSLSKLFTVLASRYSERQGGYTRVMKSGNRYGDMADMAIIEYVDRPGELRSARRPWDPMVAVVPEEEEAVVIAEN